MNSDIFKQVKSPFTDDLIQDLIKRYISCNCDENLFYRETNNLENTDTYDKHFTNELINQIYSKGIPKYDLWSKEASDQEFIYATNSDWITLYSEEDPMRENKGRK